VGHAPDRPLEHLAHLAGLEVAELFPHELCALFVVGAVEEDAVQVRVELQVGRRALHDGHHAGLGVELPALRRALRVEGLDALEEDAREVAE
jgi:hypothetical protein